MQPKTESIIRTHGKPPFTTVFIHGGPGAQNSLLSIAHDLGKYIGVLEPVQTGYNIPELLEELNEHIYSFVVRPVTLVGHSWGAWLAMLYATQHSEIVKALVLVGCAPFEDKYTAQITTRRLNRLSPQEQALFNLVLAGFDDPSSNKDYLLAQLTEFTEKTDNYELAVSSEEAAELLNVNMDMYTSLWPEAMALRQSGILASSLSMLECPVHVIHGEEDPHPITGVTIPLDKHKVAYTRHILTQCGHTPFLEKHAKDYFYDMLLDILRD